VLILGETGVVVLIMVRNINDNRLHV